jgi:hypothetical protein
MGGHFLPKVIFAVACAAWFNLFLNRKTMNQKVYFASMLSIPIALFIVLKFFIL